MRFWIFLGILIFSLSLQTKSKETEEDCLKLKNKEEQKKCSSKEYQAADKELNKAYKKIRETLSESEKEELKKLQIMWIGYRDGICEGPMYSMDETGVDTILCKTEITIDRTQYFHKVWEHPNPPKDGIGSYTDGFGGSLKLSREKSKKEIQFSFEVVRGPTAHIGEVTGSWTPNQEGKWTWASTPNCNSEDPDCCLLQFETFPNRIEVEEISCSAYHGARAYFGGSYRYSKK
ncbi:lysozyme inhibitor LprI family protein [Leptospira sarikeiensis]|uniref:DUF1311 domain-containing protein n=1 Tax=Leptospira sarikeiensis TaxID=2484943 RepID=A0A4R9K6Z4_9LEPT|nr:lysozyme inhibitor LprI family protein [Leptospira sarikeiensis]TGL62069.1 DUF1311 domain-containing protein [Leptospira sarikeiensis]